MLHYFSLIASIGNCSRFDSGHTQCARVFSIFFPCSQHIRFPIIISLFIDIRSQIDKVGASSLIFVDQKVPESKDPSIRRFKQSMKSKQSNLIFQHNCCPDRRRNMFSPVFTNHVKSIRQR